MSCDYFLDRVLRALYMTMLLEIQTTGGQYCEEMCAFGEISFSCCTN